MIPDRPNRESFESFRMQQAVTTTGSSTTGSDRFPYPVSLAVNDLIVEFTMEHGEAEPQYSGFPRSQSKKLDHMVQIMSGSTVKRQIYIRGGPETLYESRPAIDGVNSQSWNETSGKTIFDGGSGSDQDQDLSKTYPRSNYKFLYTAAQQAADFGSVQSSVTIRVRARGKYNEFGTKFGELGGFGPYLEINV